MAEELDRLGDDDLLRVTDALAVGKDVDGSVGVLHESQLSGDEQATFGAGWPAAASDRPHHPFAARESDKEHMMGCLFAVMAGLGATGATQGNQLPGTRPTAA
jgi:hypothetical protein